MFTWFNFVDIDECVIGTHDCNKPNELCRNVRGSFTCQCEDGFYRNRTTTNCEGKHSLLSLSARILVNMLVFLSCQFVMWLVFLIFACEMWVECVIVWHLCPCFISYCKIMLSCQCISLISSPCFMSLVCVIVCFVALCYILFDQWNQLEHAIHVHVHAWLVNMDIQDWYTLACKIGIHWHARLVYIGMRDWYTLACKIGIHWHARLLCVCMHN
jgi:hypothetical protein